MDVDLVDISSSIIVAIKKYSDIKKHVSLSMYSETFLPHPR